MKIKRMVKRLFAVGTGVAMLGATAMGAMAADLSDYPTMFVTDGVFNGYFVVGESAKPIDNLAMTDIATSMKVRSGKKTTTTVSGDAWMVGTSSKKYEMANSNASASQIYGETIRAINTFIGDEELKALGDGSYNTNENDFSYQQFLFFDDQEQSGADSHIVKFDENDNDVLADYFYVKNGRQIARYKLEFGSSAQSDNTDSDGAATTTGAYLDDFRNTEIKLLGQSYTIVEATRPTAGRTTSVKWILMKGATRDTLLEGASHVYKVGDKEYDVSLSFVDSTNAKFTVNGQVTNKLAVGETYVLSDKTEIGVSEILYQAYAGGVHSAQFYVGAQKLEMRDDNSTVAGGAYNMKVGSEDIDGTTVIFSGTDDTSTTSLSTVEVNITAEDDFWVGTGKKLSDVIALAGEEKEALMGGAFDIEYKGLAKQDANNLMLRTSGARRYQLRLYDGDGKMVDIPVAYAEGTNNLSWGEESWSGARTNQKRFHWMEPNSSLLIDNDVGGWNNLAYQGNMSKDDFFIVTGGTAADGSAKSYLLQYKGSDRQTKTSPKIKFKNVGSAETMEYSVTSLTATGTTATIKLGGYSFIVQNASEQATDDFNINVDLNGGGTVAAASVDFVDYYGSSWNITTDGFGRNATPEDAVTIRSFLSNADDYDNFLPMNIVLNITAASGPEVRASLRQYAPSTGGGTGLASSLLTPSGETEVAYGYTSMGAKLTFKSPSGDPQELTINYPKEQSLPQVYITSGAVTSGSKAVGDLVAVEVVSATKLDSEVSNAAAQNLVVVGGPCVNTIAAELLGNPADCTSGFTPGKARIKLFDNSGKTAMLVAGYSGADTRLAGKVVAHRWAELKGAEVEVEGTTYSDATISAPAARTVAAPAAAATTTAK